jgi:hypothetical protein
VSEEEYREWAERRTEEGKKLATRPQNAERATNADGKRSKQPRNDHRGRLWTKQRMAKTAETPSRYQATKKLPKT